MSILFSQVTMLKNDCLAIVLGMGGSVINVCFEKKTLLIKDPPMPKTKAIWSFINNVIWQKKYKYISRIKALAIAIRTIAIAIAIEAKKAIEYCNMQ